MYGIGVIFYELIFGDIPFHNPDVEIMYDEKMKFVVNPPFGKELSNATLTLLRGILDPNPTFRMTANRVLNYIDDPGTIIGNHNISTFAYSRNSNYTYDRGSIYVRSKGGDSNGSKKGSKESNSGSKHSSAALSPLKPLNNKLGDELNKKFVALGIKMPGCKNNDFRSNSKKGLRKSGLKSKTHTSEFSKAYLRKLKSSQC